MRKYFLLTLILSCLFVNFVLAKNLIWNNEYLIDQAGVFENKLADRQDIIRDLEEVNQGQETTLKILVLNLLDENNFNQYCGEGQIILIYNQQDNRLNYCSLNITSSTVTDEELNYIINELVQPNIDSGHLVFALRIGIREIARAGSEDILPEDYKIKNEIQRAEQNKQIIIWLFILVLFSWLAACLGRTRAWWLGGIVGFLLGLFIWWISGIWFFMPLLLLTGLFYDYLVSRSYKEYRNCKKGAFWCTAEELEELEELEKKRKR